MKKQIIEITNGLGEKVYRGSVTITDRYLWGLLSFTDTMWVSKSESGVYYLHSDAIFVHSFSSEDRCRVAIDMALENMEKLVLKEQQEVTKVIDI